MKNDKEKFKTEFKLRIEAQASSSKKEFVNFLHHSLKSANESKFWLALLRDTKRVSSEEVN